MGGIDTPYELHLYHIVAEILARTMVAGTPAMVAATGVS